MVDLRGVVLKIREKTKEGRELEYGEGEIGITSLLQCPLKVRFRKEYPEILPEAVEIDDGYLWEKQVKDALREVYGDRFEEEKELPLEIDGVRIRGHLDCFVEFPDLVVGVECKSPKVLVFKQVPPEEELVDGVLLVDGEERYVVNNELYHLQARIQKFILERLYPHKKVEEYLFYKALCRKGTWARKLYVLVPVHESISEEELRGLVRRFREDPSPRFPEECEKYCEFYRAGVCGGKPFRYEDGENLPERIFELLKEYRSLQTDLKNIEVQLKKLITGSVTLGNREIGWVGRKRKKINQEKLAFLLPPEKIPEFFQLKRGAEERLPEDLMEEVVEGEEVTRVWKL